MSDRPPLRVYIGMGACAAVWIGMVAAVYLASGLADAVLLAVLLGISLGALRVAADTIREERETREDGGDALRDLAESWDRLVVEFARSLRIDRLLEWGVDRFGARGFVVLLYVLVAVVIVIGILTRPDGP